MRGTFLFGEKVKTLAIGGFVYVLPEGKRSSRAGDGLLLGILTFRTPLS